MSYAQKTRSELARELHWEKSRVSKVLSGKDNLTVKTIWDFSSHLGFDFDVVFRGTNEPRPYQPWQKAPSTSLQLSPYEILSNDSQRRASRPFIDMQTAQQVFNDFLQGNHKSHYLSIDIEDRRPRTSCNSITIDAKPQTGVLTVLSTLGSSIPVAIKESK
jgi:transcriptional regulator with XRE-family HTH domain